MPYQPYLGPVVALIAGILILIQPSLLSIIVAVYLIVIGITGSDGDASLGVVGPIILSPPKKGAFLGIQGLGPGQGRNCRQGRGASWGRLPRPITITRGFKQQFWTDADGLPHNLIILDW